MLQEFIEAKSFKIEELDLKDISPNCNWIETTIGVFTVDGQTHAMSPSLTVIKGNILTEIEKFQQGDGVNFTPLPQQLVPSALAENASDFARKIAIEMGLYSVARIDAFLNVKTGNMKIIEINTNPGMSAATVIFHQAVEAGMTPIQFLETISRSAENRSFRVQA